MKRTFTYKEILTRRTFILRPLHLNSQPCDGTGVDCTDPVAISTLDDGNHVTGHEQPHVPRISPKHRETALSSSTRLRHFTATSISLGRDANHAHHLETPVDARSLLLPPWRREWYQPRGGQESMHHHPVRMPPPSNRPPSVWREAPLEEQTRHSPPSYQLGRSSRRTPTIATETLSTDLHEIAVVDADGHEHDLPELPKLVVVHVGVVHASPAWRVLNADCQRARAPGEDTARDRADGVNSHENFAPGRLAVQAYPTWDGKRPTMGCTR